MQIRKDAAAADRLLADDYVFLQLADRGVAGDAAAPVGYRRTRACSLQTAWRSSKARW